MTGSVPERLRRALIGATLLAAACGSGARSTASREADLRASCVAGDPADTAVHDTADVRPVPRNWPKPSYPAGLRRTHDTVLIAFIIGHDGAPDPQSMAVVEHARVAQLD